MAGTYLSGKNMAINAESGTGIFAFRIYQKHYPPLMVGGNQSGAVARELGNTDWGGWFRANGHTPTVLPNDEFNFQCAPRQTGDVGVSGTALCIAAEIVVDQRNPKQPVPIYHTVHFAAQGTALSTGETAPTDTSTPVVYPPKGLCAYFGSSQAHTVYQRLMLFSRGVVETVDCTTDGVFGRDGGEIDAEFEWTINTDDSSDFIDESDGQQSARLYVTSTTYWALDWMTIVDTPDAWEIDRMSPGNPVQCTFKARFSGHSGTTAGSITLPNTTEWWPTDGR